MNVEHISTADFGSLVARHRAHFLSGKTRPVEWREAQLAALSALITENAQDFHAALCTDLRRNWVEADLVDVVAKEADYARQHLREWMRPIRVSPPQIMQPGEVRVRFDPLGVGNSGMGKYHGEWGFRAYTNARGVLYHSTVADPGVRYPPYPPKPAP